MGRVGTHEPLLRYRCWWTGHNPLWTGAMVRRKKFKKKQVGQEGGSGESKDEGAGDSATVSTRWEGGRVLFCQSNTDVLTKQKKTHPSAHRKIILLGSLAAHSYPAVFGHTENPADPTPPLSFSVAHPPYLAATLSMSRPRQFRGIQHPSGNFDLITASVSMRTTPQALLHSCLSTSLLPPW